VGSLWSCVLVPRPRLPTSDSPTHSQKQFKYCAASVYGAQSGVKIFGRSIPVDCMKALSCVGGQCRIPNFASCASTAKDRE
jgi:hypothetical protein